MYLQKISLLSIAIYLRNLEELEFAVYFEDVDGVLNQGESVHGVARCEYGGCEAAVVDDNLTDSKLEVVNPELRGKDCSPELQYSVISTDPGKSPSSLLNC